MKNKVLIDLYVSFLDCSYELYIPINETIDKVIILLLKSISDSTDIAMDTNTKHYLMDPDSGYIYNDMQIVRETNIRNSKKIILI